MEALVWEGDASHPGVRSHVIGKMAAWSEVCIALCRFWPVREYPWGSCEALSSRHSDLAALKKLLFEVSLLPLYVHHVLFFLKAVVGLCIWQVEHAHVCCKLADRSALQNHLVMGSIPRQTQLHDACTDCIEAHTVDVCICDAHMLA